MMTLEKINSELSGAVFTEATLNDGTLSILVRKAGGEGEPATNYHIIVANVDEADISSN